MSGRPLIWDNHVCLPLRPDDPTFLPQIERHRRAGASVVSINVGFGAMSFDSVLANLQAFRAWFSARPDEYLLLEQVDQAALARDQGRLGIVFDLEGGDAVADQIDRLPELARLGVRWMAIAYNRNNALGGGCQDVDAGLTALGVRALAMLEQAGIVACCSHTGERTTFEVLERASRPVIFSHSNPRALCSHPRNISDEVIRRCAATGGVIGINGVGIFLGDNDASVEAVVRHVEYVQDLVGAVHVGLGLDYIYDRRELDEYLAAHPELYPPEHGYGAGLALMEPEAIPRLVEHMLRRGHRDEDVHALLGGNWRRVARATWAGYPSG